MQIEITTIFKGRAEWDSKVMGVIFVRDRLSRKRLRKALCEYDEDWKNYKQLIKVIPFDSFTNENEIYEHCAYVGKTLINVAALRKDHVFLIFQCSVGHSLTREYYY